MLSLNNHPYLMPPDTNTLVTSDILETPQLFKYTSGLRHLSLTDSKARKSGCRRCTGTATPGGYTKSKVLGPLPCSKNQHAGRATDTYLKLRNWEGKVFVFGPDMAAGILEVFHWCVLRVLAQKRERCDQDESLPGCRPHEELP